MKFKNTLEVYQHASSLLLGALESITLMPFGANDVSRKFQ